MFTIWVGWQRLQASSPSAHLCQISFKDRFVDGHWRATLKIGSHMVVAVAALSFKDPALVIIKGKKRL